MTSVHRQRLCVSGELFSGHRRVRLAGGYAADVRAPKSSSSDASCHCARGALVVAHARRAASPVRPTRPSVAGRARWRSCTDGRAAQLAQELVPDDAVLDAGVPARPGQGAGEVARGGLLDVQALLCRNRFLDGLLASHGGLASNEMPMPSSDRTASRPVLQWSGPCRSAMARGLCSARPTSTGSGRITVPSPGSSPPCSCRARRERPPDAGGIPCVRSRRSRRCVRSCVPAVGSPSRCRPSPGGRAPSAVVAGA